MDSITQFTLGAAVGEVMLGKRIGRYGALWGGLLGTLPDLDVLVLPFLNEVDGLAFHRGFSHSITFAALAAPTLGWLLYRRFRTRNVPWSRWCWLVFWAITTHFLLDCFTVYGTQVFQPFSDYAVSFDSIFIIDPLYTLPLGLGLLGSFFFRQRRALRTVPTYVGLLLSTLYLLFTVVNKHHVETVFRAALQTQGHAYTRLLTVPTAFNNLLWVGLAEDETGYWLGLYSIWDSGGPTRFRRIERNTDLLAPHRNDPAVQRLLWFSNGWYTVSQQEGQLYFSDLRFGRQDGWLTPRNSPFVFHFRLIPNATVPAQFTDFEQMPLTAPLDRTLLRRLFTRIRGH
jgi:inner membrane protein